MAGGLAVTAAHTRTYDESGYDHDVSFPAANIRPVRPNFAVPEQWFAGNTSELSRLWGLSLSREWFTRFCSVPPATIDEASRCARGTTQLPSGVQETLARRLGDDVRHLAVLR